MFVKFVIFIMFMMLTAFHSAVAKKGMSLHQKNSLPHPLQNKNISRFVARTFGGSYVGVTDEPLDWDDMLNISRGGHNHTVKNHFVISEEAEKFLKSSLSTIGIPTIYMLVFIISVPLNTIAIMMFILKIRPKKSSAILMVNLAVSDLFFVLLLPFKMSYHFKGNNWVYGPAMCRIVISAFYGNMYCSILLMMCISVDRFFAVVYPINSMTWRKQQRARVVCGVTWLVAILGVLPILLSEQDIYLSKLGITTCHDVQDISKLQAYYLYFFPTFSTLFFFIPLIITTYCYLRIIKTLSTNSKVNSAKKTRAKFMAITVLAVFVICFAPTNITLLVHYLQLAHGYSDSSYAAYLVFVCIGSVSCCLDPIIYYLGSCQFRKQVSSMLRNRASRGINNSLCISETTKLESQSEANQYDKLMA